MKILCQLVYKITLHIKKVKTILLATKDYSNCCCQLKCRQGFFYKKVNQGNLFDFRQVLTVRMARIIFHSSNLQSPLLHEFPPSFLPAFDLPFFLPCSLTSTVHQRLKHQANMHVIRSIQVMTRSFCSFVVIIIDPLHDPVISYGINCAGMQITLQKFQNRGTLASPSRLFFVLNVSLRYICVPE